MGAASILQQLSSVTPKGKASPRIFGSRTRWRQCHLLSHACKKSNFILSISSNCILWLLTAGSNDHGGVVTVVIVVVLIIFLLYFFA